MPFCRANTTTERMFVILGKGYLGILLPLQLLVGQWAKFVEVVNMLLKVLTDLAGRMGCPRTYPAGA